jgi:hypothetical protein
MYPINRICTEPALRNLLLDSLHLDPTRPDLARLAELDADAWQRFGELAIHSKVAFQILERLNRPDLRPNVPEAVYTRLRIMVKHQTVHLLALRASLREVLQGCHDAGIPVMVLKGAHLAEIIYGHPTARAMGDIDLLFKPADLPRATALFKTLGFTIPAHADNLSELAPASNEYPLSHPRWPANFDIHWSITRRNIEPEIDDSPIWERAQPVMLAGAPGLAMALEDLLPFLCFHGVYHHQFASVGPRLLVDIAKVCAYSRTLNWAQVAERSRTWGWGRGVFLVLSLAHERLGAPTPADVLEQLAPDQSYLAETQAAALDSLFQEIAAEQGIGRNIISLWNAPTLWERLQILWRRLFPPLEELLPEFNLKASDPCPGRHRLYARRFKRLLFQHSIKFWNLWRGEPARLAELQRHRQLARWLNH